MPSFETSEVAVVQLWSLVFKTYNNAHRRGSWLCSFWESGKYIILFHFLPKARKCFTFCGSIWGDGSPGPMAISVCQGGISEKLKKEINLQNTGLVYVMQSRGSSHMMDSESILDMYNSLYQPAFKLRRQKLGLSHSTPGFLVCDGFTGAHSKSSGFSERRDRFAESSNVVLPPELPGGWSAKGQPADQVFALYKANVRLAMDVALGFGGTYFRNSGYESLPLAATGHSSNFELVFPQLP